jgi:hypothetical protein
MKDLKISKELFEAVYNCDITTDKDMLGVYKSINLYEFTFKCKEWILNKGYSQLSGKDDIYEKGMGFVCSIGSIISLVEDFYADTEVEAVIKAS